MEPSALCFKVNTHLHPTDFFPRGKGTKSHVLFLFLFKESISTFIDRTRPEFHPGTRAESCGYSDIIPMSSPQTKQVPSSRNKREMGQDFCRKMGRVSLKNRTNQKLRQPVKAQQITIPKCQHALQIHNRPPASNPTLMGDTEQSKSFKSNIGKE